MTGVLESVVAERMELIATVKSVFRAAFPNFPFRIRRGEVQEELLLRIEESPHGYNRRIVNEAMKELGYRKVKIQGFHYFSR